MRARARPALFLTTLTIVAALIGGACVFGGEGDRDLSEFFPEAPAPEPIDAGAPAAAEPAPVGAPAETPIDEALLDVTVPPRTALEAVQKYYALLSLGRLEDAYRQLSLEARTRISSEDFVQRHDDIWAEATITGLTWQTVPPPGENVAGIEVDLVYATSGFGELRDRVFAPTVREPNWVLDWTPDLIFDGLAPPGYLVHRFVDVPPRGDIFDRNGVPLANKGEIAVIGVSLDLITDEAAVVDIFVDLLDLDELAVRNLVFQPVPSYFFIPIVRLDHNTDPALVAQFEQMADLGILVRRETIRRYPQGRTASHVVGFLQEVTEEELLELAPLGYQPGDLVGRDGAEALFERELAGRRGGRLAIIAPDGRTVRELGEQPLTPAQDVYLTIDVRVQEVAELALGEDPGAIIVQDLRGNELLAVASFPRFDPNDFIGRLSEEQFSEYFEDERRPFVNRASEETYAPGSTFKIVTAAAALGALGYSADTQLPCDAIWTGLGPDASPLHNWKEDDAGNLRLPQALAESCNTFFYEVGKALHLQDENVLTEYASGFGFGRETGAVGLFEHPGINPGPEWKRLNLNDFWYTGDTVNVSIGQGFLDVTPLQLANAYAALATDGILRTPLAAHSLRTPEGEILLRFTPTPIGVLPVSASAQTLLQQGTREVISTARGTGFSIFRSSPLRAAGKSGTAEDLVAERDPNEDEPGEAEAPPPPEPPADEAAEGEDQAPAEEGEADDTRNHAWFVVWANVPLPKALVTVVVDDGESGADVAGPIARLVLERTLLSGWVE